MHYFPHNIKQPPPRNGCVSFFARFKCTWAAIWDNCTKLHFSGAFSHRATDRSGTPRRPRCRGSILIPVCVSVAICHQSCCLCCIIMKGGAARYYARRLGEKKDIADDRASVWADVLLKGRIKRVCLSPVVSLQSTGSLWGHLASHLH